MHEARTGIDELTISVDRQRWELRRRGAQFVGAVILAVGLVLGTVALGNADAVGAVLVDPTPSDIEFGRAVLAFWAILAILTAVHWWLLWVRRLESGMASVDVVPPEEVGAIERRLGLAESGHGGLGFRFHAGLARWTLVGVVVIVATTMTFALWRASATGDPFLVVLFAAFAAYGIATLVVARGGALILTAERVLHRTQYLDVWAPYTVREVTWSRGRPGSASGMLQLNVRAVDGPRRYRRRAWWIISHSAQGPRARQSLLSLAVHPVVAGETVRFYLMYPERRAELGTPSAVDRVRRAVEAAR